MELTSLKLNRVCTSHGKPAKSWNFVISFSRAGKSSDEFLSVGHGIKSLKMMFMGKNSLRMHSFRE